MAELQPPIGAAGKRASAIPTYSVERIRVPLGPGKGQAPPRSSPSAAGRVELDDLRQDTPPAPVVSRTARRRFTQTLESSARGRSVPDHRVAQREHSGARDPRDPAAPLGARPQVAAEPAVEADFAAVRLKDVARQVGLAFRQDSFRYGIGPAIRRR